MRYSSQRGLNSLRLILVIIAFHFSLFNSSAQSKLSPWLRQIVKNDAHLSPRAPYHAPIGKSSTIAFVRLSSDDDNVLSEHGCRSLAHFGDLHIAAIPIARLSAMCADSRVLRIEASPCGQVLTDSMALHLNATQAYSGTGLPQAYSGQGVVMGVMDIGFDLTHPNFFSTDTTNYRIRRFWDMLSADTVGSVFPVGRDYTTRDELLALGHARDGLDFDHGTHTLGIAAGSGYNTRYRGIAPDADICLVANAVSDDLKYIDSADVYKYTYATDALGFKYLFDYAESVGKPCVASFSEGSPQDFYGYDQLYYAFLDSLCGPGRIIVAASGNDGYKGNYVYKPRGRNSAGTFLRTSGDTTMTVVMKSRDDFSLRLVAYANRYDTLTVDIRQVLASEDSVLTINTPYYQALFEVYPSSYDADETCLDLTLTSSHSIGYNPRLSIELLGEDADVEMWRVGGNFNVYSPNPSLNDAQSSHFVLSPGSAPCVIAVGSTSYRDSIVNLSGDTLVSHYGTDGRRAEFSSMGPTFDNRVKPDCVSPGNCIISSYSSYRLEEHPDNIKMHTQHFPFNGRTYAWGTNSGTSMSTPAVAGAIALWLEAKPTLTPDDIKALLQRTCRHYDETLPYPNNLYGYGEVDVYAGLLDILGLSSIRDIARPHTTARITISAGTMHIVLPEAAASDTVMRLYDLGGRPVFSTILSRGCQSYTLALPSLSPGIYAVCLGATSTLIRVL